MEDNRMIDQNNEIEIDLGELIRLMFSKIWIIIICFVVGAVLAFGGTKLIVTPTYESSATIYILTKTTSVTSLADIQMGEQLTADFETLAKSRPVVEQVMKQVGLDVTYEDAVKMISTSNPEDTRILKITAEHEDPKTAMEIANAMATVTAERVAYVMDTDKPNIVETAVAADKPSSPSTMKNTVLGAMIGAILAVGLILLAYLLDDTVKTEEDVRKYLDLHTLAAIPLQKRK